MKTKQLSLLVALFGSVCLLTGSVVGFVAGRHNNLAEDEKWRRGYDLGRRVGWIDATGGNRPPPYTDNLSQERYVP